MRIEDGTHAETTVTSTARNAMKIKSFILYYHDHFCGAERAVIYIKSVLKVNVKELDTAGRGRCHGVAANLKGSW